MRGVSQLDMEHHATVFLKLNGIPSEKPPTEGEVFFYLDPQGAWLPSCGNQLYDIETECVHIHNALAASIFGDLASYYALLPTAPEFLATAGLNSESTISRIEFENSVNSNKNDTLTNQLLYLYDCRKLVSSIQECSKEVLYLQGEFYRTLNLDHLFFPAIEEPDGVRYITSPVVTKIHALLGFIFVRLHSILDYITKLAFEVENLREGFLEYPRLSSRKILFGDCKRISFNGAVGSLYEDCDLITEIELYRNLIIHDGLLDDMPKIYKAISNGNTVEKFILLPDRGAEGQLERYKNRSLFFSRDDKINLRLTALILEFQTRQTATLKAIKQILMTGSEVPNKVINRTS